MHVYAIPHGINGGHHSSHAGPRTRGDIFTTGFVEQKTEHGARKKRVEEKERQRRSEEKR